MRLRLGSSLFLIGLMLAFVLGSPAAVEAQVRQGGGDGTIYVGGYGNSIIIIDEATEQVAGEIPLQTGMSRSLVLSKDRTKFYSLNTMLEAFETVDIASRTTLDSFTLSEGSRKVRIRGVAVDPLDRYVILLIRPATLHIDRFEIEPATLVQVDLGTHEITQTIPWPDGKERDRISMVFSPDGDFLYFMGDDIIVYETDGFTEVDRWELSAPLESGLGAISLGARDDFREDPGFFTGLFRTSDPVQGRRMMGVARVNLAERDLDFFTLGPSEAIGFALAPDRQTAYGLLQQIHRYEFWTIDLEQRRVTDRTPFRGRPRMALTTSTNGELLYVYQAGNTIDLYDAETKAYLRTITLDADLTTDLFVVPKEPGAVGQGPGIGEP